MKKYAVRHLIDSNYQVVELVYNEDGEVINEFTVHQGSLADCEAYIRLKENGYM